MQTITIEDVMRDTADTQGEVYCIYVIRDNATVFYVGKANRHIIDRLREHLGLSQRTPTPSSTGEFVKANAPESDKWQVELFTLDDCAPHVKTVFPNFKRWDVEVAEKAMIRTLRPCLNGTYNFDPMPLPTHYRRE